MFQRNWKNKIPDQWKTLYPEFPVKKCAISRILFDFNPEFLVKKCAISRIPFDFNPEFPLIFFGHIPNSRLKKGRSRRPEKGLPDPHPYIVLVTITFDNN